MIATEVNLGACQTSKMKHFGKNSWQVLVVNYICKKASSHMFARVPNFSL